MHQIIHRPIEKAFTQGPFTYLQIKREGDLAIYKARFKDTAKKTEWFEVIIISRHDGYSLGGKWVEPAESYTGASQFGIKGFTLLTIERAEAKFQELRKAM